MRGRWGRVSYQEGPLVCCFDKAADCGPEGVAGVLASSHAPGLELTTVFLSLSFFSSVKWNASISLVSFCGLST